ncbi:MAG: GCN5-related N-acetyltransferase, partial [Sporolactobacillus laevolacticus]|nr:GCN5-related N-acetyltransferase [Sporolactobacillus laevolacticus]
GGYELLKGEIRKLKIEDFKKCASIWDMEKQSKLAGKFYRELQVGNRETFVYVEDGLYIGEGSIVFDMQDPDYTIDNQRLYFSRLIVKDTYCHRGIGNAMIDFLVDYSQRLGYKEMSIGVDLDNVIARNLYKKKGFTHVLFQGKDEQGAYEKLLKKLPD